MDFFYMDGGPFETTRIKTGRTITVIGYDSATGIFLAARRPGEEIWDTAANFTPPPPIPAAARKPQIGEVWIMRTTISKKHVARLVIRPSSGGYDTFTPDMCLDWYSCDWVIRPATPEEAEPFRPVLEGLKHSLGEA